MGFVRKIWELLTGQAGIDSGDTPCVITVVDDYGQKYEIPRKEWETNFLPQQIADAHEDAEALCEIIVGALRDGFARRLMSASNRLLEIDHDKERSHTVRSIVLMQSGKLRGAEQILSQFIKQFGPTGIVLTNLAKVYAAKGREAKAESTLWQALQLDPNQENGLLWWATWKNERQSGTSFWDAMLKAAVLPGAWRPQLWLARRCLEQGKLDQALRYYEDVLKVAIDHTDALTMISGDLGNGGYCSQMLKLVLPVYDPEKHEVETGLNLLQACLSTKNLTDGEKILHQMFALNLPGLRETLFQYSLQFDELRTASTLPVATKSDEELIFSLISIENPVWTHSLQSPSWLLADVSELREEVLLIPLAAEKKEVESEHTVQLEDDIGRLTRSLPLYLLESIRCWTSFRPRLVVPVVKGGGPVVSGEEISGERICNLADARFAVSGILSQYDDCYWLRISIWNVSETQLCKVLQYKLTNDGFGEVTLKLEADLLNFLDSEDAEPSRIPFYRRPQAKLIRPYLEGLGQSLTFSVIKSGVVPLQSLRGERNMLNHLLQLALQTPQEHVSKIMFLEALLKSHDIGSSIYLEFRQQALQLVEDEKDSSSPVYRLSPLLFKVLDPELFHLRKTELLKNATGEYRTWLQHLSIG